MTATLRKVVPFALLLGIFSVQALALAACEGRPREARSLSVRLA